MTLEEVMKRVEDHRATLEAMALTETERIQERKRFALDLLEEADKQLKVTSPEVDKAICEFLYSVIDKTRLEL